MGWDCFSLKDLPEVNAPGAHLCGLDSFRNLTETNAETAGARLDFRRQLGETSRAWRSPGPRGGHNSAHPSPHRPRSTRDLPGRPVFSPRGLRTRCAASDDLTRPEIRTFRVPIQSLKRSNYFFFTGTLATHKLWRWSLSVFLLVFLSSRFIAVI